MIFFLPQTFLIFSLMLESKGCIVRQANERRDLTLSMLCYLFLINRILSLKQKILSLRDTLHFHQVISMPIKQSSLVLFSSFFYIAVCFVELSDICHTQYAQLIVYLTRPCFSILRKLLLFLCVLIQKNVSVSIDWFYFHLVSCLSTAVSPLSSSNQSIVYFN